MSRHGPVLVVMGGLPGTGKTTLAEALGEHLGAPIFNRDQLEAALWREGVGRELKSGRIANELMTTLAGEQLRCRQSAILDSVATTRDIRDAWRAVAEGRRAQFRAIECVCSDEALHRERLGQRKRDIPGWYEVGWDEVLGVQSRYQPWTGDHLTLDCVTPLSDNIQRMLQYVEDRDS
jgi:predicted kinase